MKHPDQNTWIAYLYQDELPPADRAKLDTHLAECRSCRQQLESWNLARQRLNAWSLPRQRPAPRRTLPLLRLAASIALLATTFALGRHAFPAQPHPAALRQEIATHLAQTLRPQLAEELAAGFQSALQDSHTLQEETFTRWLADYAAVQDHQRRQDLNNIQQAIVRLDSQQRADYAELRREMETMAILTDASFRHTQEQLFQVASTSSESWPENP
jgi:hypothetical protein